MTGLQKFTLLCFVFAASFLVFVNVCYAYDVPEDAVIKVFTKDGKQIGEMSRSEYKVVKINSKATPKVNVQIAKVIYKKPEIKHHRITARFGVGPQGLENRNTGSEWVVSEFMTPVAGLGYSYRFDNNFSLGVSGLTNKTFTLDLGQDF